MKKVILLILILSSLVKYASAQTERVVGPAEKRITDSICACVSRLDISKITTKNEAIAAYTDCVTQNADLLTPLADERKVDIGDQEQMRKIGIDIAMTLMKNKCAGFIKLSVMMAKNENSDAGSTGTTSGKLSRIDNKGFNYFAVTDATNSEKSFIWLRQFPGSEKFTNGLGAYAGKRVTIKWDEIEVYLPAAKGYYKVKEIVELTFE
jgi:hypothetical protein